MTASKTTTRKRTRRVEQPGNPDQVTEAKAVEQQSNIEAQEEEQLKANVRYVQHKEPPIGTVQGNFVLTENGWSQHAPRTAAQVAADETELEENEDPEFDNEDDDQE